MWMKPQTGTQNWLKPPNRQTIIDPLLGSTWPRGLTLWIILVPRGRAPFGQHQESRPLAWSNDILFLNGFVNTIDWDQNQSDLSNLTVNIRRVTGSPWIAVLDLARGRDSWCWPKGARPLGTRMSVNVKNTVYLLMRSVLNLEPKFDVMTSFTSYTPGQNLWDIWDTLSDQY